MTVLGERGLGADRAPRNVHVSVARSTNQPSSGSGCANSCGGGVIPIVVVATKKLISGI